MTKLTILNKLKSSSFREKNTEIIDEIMIEGAIFLTYSIDCKSILSALLSMFADELPDATDEVEAAVKQSGSGEVGKHSEKRDIVKCWQHLLAHGMSTGQCKNSVQAFQELQEHVAFVCNDGYDKSVASPIYWYTRELTYYYKWTKEEGRYSFHPKLYIVKYRKNGELFFRFMIGSMNFVNSKNQEFMAVFDVRAFEEQKGPEGKEYVHCYVLKELLNLKSDYTTDNIQNGQKTKLCRVIEHLGLDRYYFDKEIMERIITFPQSRQDILAPFLAENNQGEEQSKPNMILSPFLTKGLLDKLNGNTRLYTMEGELRKLGYVPVGAEVDALERSDAEGTETKSFYVYSVPEGEKAFTHIKLYASEEGVYVGSANFTQSALGGLGMIGRNKEILVRLDADAGFREELEAYLETHYRKETFRYVEAEKAEPDIGDVFRTVVEKIIYCLEQRICAGGKVWESRLVVKEGKRDIWDALQREAFVGLKRTLELEKEECVDLRVAPFCSRNGEKSLLGTDFWEWQINDRLKLDDAFIFTLYINKKARVQLKYHITTLREGTAGEKDTTDIIMAHTLCRLELLLGTKGLTTAMLTKNSEDIERGALRRDTIGYVRRSMPTLELLLKRSLAKGSLSEESISLQIQRLNQLADQIEKEDSLLEEEKKLLGIDGTNRKVIENLLIQGNALLKELQGR